MLPLKDQYKRTQGYIHVYDSLYSWGLYIINIYVCTNMISERYKYLQENYSPDWYTVATRQIRQKQTEVLPVIYM